MTTTSINSIARTCSLLQRGYGMVSKAADQLKLTPAAIIDGAPYYSDDQVEQLRQHFEAKSAKRS